MGEELSIDVKVSQQNHPDVLFVDLEELQKLRDHVFAVKAHRQEAFFTTLTTSTGIWSHKSDDRKRTFLNGSSAAVVPSVTLLSDLTTLGPEKMWQEAFHSHRFCKNERVQQFGHQSCRRQLFRETLDPIQKKPAQTHKCMWCKTCL